MITFIMAGFSSSPPPPSLLPNKTKKKGLGNIRRKKIQNENKTALI